MRTLKTVLAVAIGCFILAGVYISTIIVERQDALKNLARDNVSIVAAQTVSELVRFKRLLSDQALQDEGVDGSQIQLRYKSILDRAQHLTEGDFAEFLLQSPERQTAVRQFKEGLAAVQPSLENLTSSTIQDAHRLLDDVELPLAALVSLAQQYNGDRVARDQSVLTRLHWLFSTLGSGLILFGCVLIVLLGWRNRLLVRAQEELRRFAENFQNMSVKLERTNKALSAAYAELQLRNESLQSQELELRTQNERFNAALDNMSHGLCMVDADERIIVFNARFAQLFHLDEAVAPGTTLSRSVDRLLQSASPCNQALAQIYSHQRDLMRERRHSTFTSEFCDGRTFAIAHQPMSEGGWVATYEDITERRQAESQIAYMAHHDALTDLANRVLFRHEMEHALAGMQGRVATIAVLFLDLDRFKDVNDSLGHETGDALLKIVAERLRRCLREGDVVARLGGDEFAVLQLGVREHSDCSALAMRIVDTIGMPYELDGQEIVIGASVGIALADTPDETPDQLLKHADLALYHAKASGRGTFRFFEPQMDAELQARRVMEADLRKALANAEFELFYQPQVCLPGERVSGFEALVRWRHPDRGMVSPGEFIPIAEDIGLIVPLGEWVIEQACLTAAAWPEDIMIAVNLSSAQLRHKSLVHCVSRALAQAGLAANRLELEITESVLLQDNDATTATLHQLRRLGVRIALDDFGTGYSSLSYLRSFPFDKIKIDQSFVRELSSRADCFAIVQSLANLGEMLGMSTVAEGVETEDQLDQIRAAGCTNVQGFYFGRPKPVHELHHHLAASGRTAALI